MNSNRGGKPVSSKYPTTVERRSERELVVTRTFSAPARIVFEAWSKPALFERWWAPRSFGLSFMACEMDARIRGRYRLEFSHPASDQPVAFFGTYLDVVPSSRLVWTNEEAGDESGPITTVTFEERDGDTIVVKSDLYPSKIALDDEITSGTTCAVGEQFEQLDDLLVNLT